MLQPKNCTHIYINIKLMYCMYDKPVSVGAFITWSHDGEMWTNSALVTRRNNHLSRPCLVHQLAMTLTQKMHSIHILSQTGDTIK